jgi:hypothetical protein
LRLISTSERRLNNLFVLLLIASLLAGVAYTVLGMQAHAHLMKQRLSRTVQLDGCSGGHSTRVSIARQARKYAAKARFGSPKHRVGSWMELVSAAPLAATSGHSMKFSKLYDKLIQAWPTEIALSDASPAFGKGAQLFPMLSAAFREIESEIDVKNHHWANLGQWAFFQAFHAEAAVFHQSGILVLKPHEVPHEALSMRVVRDLSSIYWKAERENFLPFPH